MMPCRTGLLVCAAACAIAAEPSPDSLEKTPRATPNRMAGRNGRAREPAGRGGRREGVGEDHADRGRNLGDVDHDDQEGRAQVEHDHRRDKLAGDVADPADSADDHDGDQGRNDDSRDPGRHREAAAEGGRHRVDLHRVADPEGGDGSEDREQEPEPLPELGSELAHAVPQVVHRAADVLPGRVDLAVRHRADGLGVLRGHPEQRDQPHVEDGAGSPQRNRGRDPGDVPGANGRGQCRHQGVEGLDLPLSSDGVLVEEQAEPVADLPPRHEDETERQQDAGDAENAQHRRAPGESVHGTYD